MGFNVPVHVDCRMYVCAQNRQEVPQTTLQTSHWCIEIMQGADFQEALEPKSQQLVVLGLSTDRLRRLLLVKPVKIMSC